MIDAGSLTKDQQVVVAAVEKAIRTNERLFVLWYGGVRAGKSTGATISMLLHSMQRTGKTYMVGAYTARQAAAIFMPIFKTYAAVLGLSYKERRGTQPQMRIGDNVFEIYGGDKIGKEHNIQGLTLAGLLLDELPLLQREFITQAEARISEVGALRVYTANKMSPYHWTTKAYYNRARDGKINAMLVDSNTHDNPYIDEAFISEKETEYDDMHYSRFIANEFVLDKPPLYTPVVDDVTGQLDVTALYSDGTAIYTLNANRTDYGYGVVSMSSFPVNTPLSGLGCATTVLVNSERPMLARQLRKQGVKVRGYTSDYIPRRLEQTQDALNTGKIKISPELDELTEAMDTYHTGGFYHSPYIRTLEMLGEYVSRR